MDIITSNILMRASEVIGGLKGKSLDVISITRPPDIQYARNLAKVLSKLSPLLGNMIEFSIISQLNNTGSWPNNGYWARQDPGFPDAIFVGGIDPSPGIEIKTWFPLATEITARFRDSLSQFKNGQVLVAVIAWLPEFLLYGKPQLIDVWIGSAQSLARARDLHYHNPPDYLVLEPEDTTARTPNLRQTNTNGYKFQGSPEEMAQAEEQVRQWGKSGQQYQSTPQYQALLRALMGRYKYRLDTNFAKIDRIQHPGLEEFKRNVLATPIHGRSILSWTREARLLSGEGVQELLQLE